MTGLAVVSIVLGVLVVSTRAPLVFAPERTLTWYRTLLATDARVRAMGVLAIVLGLALALSAQQVEGAAAAAMGYLGWYFAGGSLLFLIALPRVYRELAQAVLDIIEGIAPILGCLSVAIGVGFLYLGLAVF